MKLAPGDPLPNGAIVIEDSARDEFDEGVVLALRPGYDHDMYVTWRIDKNNTTFLGHYTSSLALAVEDYNRRKARYTP